MLRFVAIFGIFIASVGALLGNFLEVSNNIEFIDDIAIKKSFINNKAEALQDVEEAFKKLYQSQHLPSLTLELWMREKQTYALKEGYLDLENNVQATFDAKYRLCSITKTFTSALIGQLVDQGKLSYDTPINSVLKPKDFPMKKWKGKEVNITVGELLSHKAGLHVTSLDDFNTVVLTPNATQMIHKFKDEPLRSKPGTKFEYSNYGFEVLTAIVESVTHRPYVNVMYEFLRKNALNDTHLETDDLMVKNRARNYRFQPLNVTVNVPTMLVDQLVQAERWFGSGGIMSNLNNLVHWGRLMIDAYKGRPNAILSQKTVREMWTPRTSPEPALGNFTYGYGWVISNITHQNDPLNQHRYYVWHSGGLTGSSSMLIIYPEEEIVGVAFANKGLVSGLSKLIVNAVENLYDL